MQYYTLIQQHPLGLDDFSIFMHKHTSLLTQLWLTPKEASVYLAARQYGPCPASSLARIAGIPRPTCHAILKELVQKWFCSELKRWGISVFSSLDPALQIQRQEQHLQLLKEHLPELLALGSSSGSAIQMRFFEGIEGIKQMYMDQLSSQSGIRSFLGTTNIDPDLMQFFRTDFLPQRKLKDLKAFKILTDSRDSKAFVANDKKEFRESLLIQGLTLGQGNEIVMYGPNKISIALFHTKIMLGVIIVSEQLYTTLSGVFDLLRKSYHHNT